METLADRKLFFIEQYFFDDMGRYWTLSYSRKARGWDNITDKANSDRQRIVKEVLPYGFVDRMEDRGQIIFEIDLSGDTSTLCTGGDKTFSGTIGGQCASGESAEFIFKNGKFICTTG